MLLAEVVLVQEDEKSRNLDMETSEDERRRSRGRSLKKKTMNASMKFTNTLRKRGKRVANCRYASISIEDVRDAEEEEAVNTFREALLANNLLPDRFDDYHTMLRLVNYHILYPFRCKFWRWSTILKYILAVFDRLISFHVELEFKRQNFFLLLLFF